MIDDSRKLLQGFIAPELKALQEQVKGLEGVTRAEFTKLDKSIDARFSALESAISSNKDVILAQIKSLEGKVDSNHASVLNTLNIEKRLEQLERLQQAATAIEEASVRSKGASHKSSSEAQAVAEAAPVEGKVRF